jgi:hypothetical protein
MQVHMAEQKCRKIRRGNVPYSDELQTVRNKIEAWSLLLRFKKGCKISSCKLTRSLKKANIPANTRANTQIVLKEELQVATKQYYELKRKASLPRESE